MNQQKPKLPSQEIEGQSQNSRIKNEQERSKRSSQNQKGKQERSYE